MGDFPPKDPLYDDLPPFLLVSQVLKIHHKKKTLVENPKPRDALVVLLVLLMPLMSSSALM